MLEFGSAPGERAPPPLRAPLFTATRRPGRAEVYDPDRRMTPEQEDADRAVFDRVVLRSEQLRATLLVVVAAAGTSLVVLVPLIFREHVQAFFREGQGIWVMQACFSGLLLYASALRVWIGRRRARQDAVPRALQIVTTCVEALIPTAFLWALGSFLGPATSLFLPPPMLYFLFIVVSTLRLDVGLCVLTGVLSGASYFAMALWSLAQPDATALPLLLASPYQHLGRALLLVICGGLAGIVSSQIRRQVSEGVALLRERDRIAGVFGQHVSPAVVSRLLADERARPELRRVCVMFVDVRGFTRFAEARDPQTVVDYLNRLFDVLVERVDARGGIVNKFLGDGFMAIFGAPLPAEDPAHDAAAAALEMVARVDAEVAAGALPPTRIGVGLHLGEALTGTVGSQRRREYTVIGDAVNVAARLESLNKRFNTSVLASAEVVQALAGRIATRPLGEATIAGRSAPIEVHALA